MSLSDVNSYISLKATLQSQIDSDDTVANIQTTLNSITSKKASILSGLSSSTVLNTDVLNTVSTESKTNFNSVVHFCKYGDADLRQILIGWYTRIDGQIASGSDPSAAAALYTKLASILTIIKAAIPANALNFIRVAVQNP